MNLNSKSIALAAFLQMPFLNQVWPINKKDSLKCRPESWRNLYGDIELTLIDPDLPFFYSLCFNPVIKSERCCSYAPDFRRKVAIFAHFQDCQFSFSTSVRKFTHETAWTRLYYCDQATLWLLWKSFACIDSFTTCVDIIRDLELNPHDYCLESV